MTSELQGLTESARQVHRNLMTSWDTELAVPCFVGKSSCYKAKLPSGEILTIAYTPYDARSVDLIGEQCLTLVGRSLRSIAFIVPSPLQIVSTGGLSGQSEGWEPGLPDVLARKIAHASGVPVFEPASSLSNWEIIKGAGDKARMYGVDRTDIVGAVVGSVARSINTVCSVDIHMGIEYFRPLLPRDIDLIELYECGHTLMTASKEQIFALREQAATLALSLGFSDHDKNPYPDALFDQQALHGMLEAEPSLRRDILGLGVCAGAKGRTAPDYAGAAHAAYQAWRGHISFASIHEAIGPMRELRNLAAERTPRAVQYLERIDEALEGALKEKTHEDIRAFIRSNPQIETFFVVADASTAHHYRQAIEQELLGR